MNYRLAGWLGRTQPRPLPSSPPHYYHVVALFLTGSVGLLLCDPSALPIPCLTLGHGQNWISLIPTPT